MLVVKHLTFAHWSNVKQAIIDQLKAPQETYRVNSEDKDMKTRDQNQDGGKLQKKTTCMNDPQSGEAS